MQHSNQYFFSVEKLEKLISHYKTDKKSSKKLKGFVFSAGLDKKGKKSTVYALPVYTETAINSISGDMIVHNTDAQVFGCPYPPLCQ